jgi:DNA-binding response OmpR family regulator
MDVRKRVLIVEDEPNIVDALSFLLQRAGLAVSTECDGARAVQRIQADQPDLVILDVMLPNRSGFEIFHDLRSGPGLQPPVLMLTAKGQERDRQRAAEAGVDAFMTKPFANAEIVARVLDLLA